MEHVVLSVTDDEIKGAMKYAFEKLKVVLGKDDCVCCDESH